MLELLVQSFPCVNKCTAEFGSWHLPFHGEIGSRGWLLSNWGWKWTEHDRVGVSCFKVHALF